MSDYSVLQRDSECAGVWVRGRVRGAASRVAAPPRAATKSRSHAHAHNTRMHAAHARSHTRARARLGEVERVEQEARALDGPPAGQPAREGQELLPRGTVVALLGVLLPVVGDLCAERGVWGGGRVCV